MRVLFKLLGALALTGVLGTAAVATAAEITGAGATFPYPVYAKWAEAYKAKTNVALNYQSIGSGGGIKQIRAGTVDFGASDKPLTEAELAKDGLMQFPTVVGGVVPIVNVTGVKPGQLKLSAGLLADIYLGKIKVWNAPQIAAENPGLRLPAESISVVHRSDGSGTTFIFTNYLAKVSPEWKRRVGNDSAVNWPVGLGGKGNEGVASYTQRLKGAIGYVEYAYAIQNKMTYALLKNRGNVYVKPDEESFKAAAANADWAKAPGFYEILTDEPGKNSWPITGATFILVHKVQKKPEVAATVLQFFDWAYKDGGKLALDLDYIPLPPNVVTLIQNAWRTSIKDANGQPIWK